MPFVEAIVEVEAIEVIRGFSILVGRVTEPLMGGDEAVGRALDGAVVEGSDGFVVKDGTLVGTEPTTIVGNVSVTSSVALRDPVVVVEDVVTGILYGWSEVIGNTMFDDSVTGGGSGDSSMTTVIVNLLLTFLAFVTDMFELTGDSVVNIGFWGAASEVEAGVGEIMGVES